MASSTRVTYKPITSRVLTILPPPMGGRGMSSLREGARLSRVSSVAWGHQLLLDVRGCKLDAASGEEQLRALLHEIARAVGSNPDPARLAKRLATDRDGNPALLSLVQLMEHGTITAHFVCDSRDAYIDILSCRPFTVWKVERIVDRALQPEAMTLSHLHRQAE